MDGLTAIQDDCLRIIERYIKEKGRPPTRREVAKLAGQKSTHGINQILRALVKKGYVNVAPRGRPRNIVVLQGPPEQPSAR